eukprot:CAMPEP_0176341944 /NCGR_PEP_ID=MMETSP0126-20121128/2781_1 /TAXON_ID=141414 ORGANISM="Strombidinopsis acuminatum, Strain SPMC142" /NCGR_SAMPLE_ID=MMETSP0126 /ASSEMBLY_ACC=CAM_ASM_000229 /LENGTH=91 /DNA_ID=CAMNT_0017687061 /DNA_START=238 /DNA_END=513 /DNA_ORIENTATION=+
MYKETKKEYESVVEKLHQMNKARHDLETRLSDEIDRNKSLIDIISMKDETLNRKGQEIEDLDRRIIDLERSMETLEIGKQGVERQFDLVKK